MKPKLVIADDMQVVREALIRGLQGDFEIVAEVGDGIAAIEACLSHQPQLLLIDLMMPKCTGIQAVKKILQEILMPPKILMLSGITDEIYVKKAFEAGVNEYIFKPIDTRKISQTLWACVSEFVPNAI